MKHTPELVLPLRISTDLMKDLATTAYQANGDQLFSMTHLNTKRQAEQIIHAVNSYKGMLEALKEWYTLWLYIRENYPQVELPNTLHGSSDACGRLRAIIAKVEAKP